MKDALLIGLGFLAMLPGVIKAFRAANCHGDPAKQAGDCDKYKSDTIETISFYAGVALLCYWVWKFFRR